MMAYVRNVEAFDQTFPAIKIVILYTEENVTA